MPSNYIIIGGGAYLPGSAAAKRAQELYNAMPRPAPATSVPSPSVPTTPTSPAAKPSTFPSYLPGASTTPGGSSSLSPGPATTGHGAYGLIPSVPSPASTALGSITGNQTNLPALTTLATGTTQLNANLAALPYQLNLPNYGGMTQSASQGITSNLAGVVDPQEWTQLTQRAAERGARLGISPGSPNFNTALLTALDQSIAGRQALGQQQLSAAVARTPTGQPFNTAGQQVSPTDVQAAQWQSNVMGAAPDPTLAAQANLDMLLKSIEAGKTAGLGGVGGGGGGGVLPMRPAAPGASYNPFAYGGGYYGGGVGGGSYAAPAYAAPSAPGVVPVPASGYGYPQSPNVDYSVGEGGQPYPVDMTDYFSNLGYDYGGGTTDQVTYGTPETDWSSFGVYDPMEEYYY